MKNFFLNRYEERGQLFNPKTISIMPSLRVNTLKTNNKLLCSRLQKKGVKLTKIPFLNAGFWFESSFSLGATPEYLSGLYYLQEAASQLPAQILNPSKTDVVLDCCAAPGSKTTHLAQLMNNKGTIVALDINKKRLKALNNNVERLGISNTIMYQLDAKSADSLGLVFDKILVDAPCSGNFVLEQDWFTKRDIEGVKNNAYKQMNIIKTCISILKTGGVLVYSTCSLELEENEEVIEYALDNFPVKLEPINLPIGTEGLTKKTRLCKRFWPHIAKTQGFFIAKLRKV